ncbi:hypothetical protein [Actinoplanes solisilvae]|uniref:hypothetical protein n=1 Tax=Actinoplanes solisilvae TaxID=2486853 RepID=UPI000FDAEEE2|nr:hypothetical protein [Actinoplanes solisilvae]
MKGSPPSAAYFAVGVLLLLFGAGVAGALEESSRPLLFVQFVVGVVLFALSFWVESRKDRAMAAVVRWRDRAVGGAAGARGLAAIGRLLERMSAWMLAKGGGMLSWVLGIAGFLVARDAVVRLWFPQLMGGA